MLGSVEHMQSLHEREYGAEAFNLLFFLDRHGAHGFAQVFLKLAESHAERGQGFVLVGCECRPVAQWQQLLDLTERVGQVLTHSRQVLQLGLDQQKVIRHSDTPFCLAIR